MRIDYHATFARIDEMVFTHDGVHGTIRTGRRNGYSYIEHHASARGRRSAA